MHNQNGFEVFSNGDEVPPFPGLEDALNSVDFSRIDSPYGFLLVSVKCVRKWRPASREDFIKAEARRLGVAPDQVKEFSGCQLTTPRACAGFCDPIGSHCILVRDKETGQSYCLCGGGD